MPLLGTGERKVSLISERCRKAFVCLGKERRYARSLKRKSFFFFEMGTCLSYLRMDGLSLFEREGWKMYLLSSRKRNWFPFSGREGKIRCPIFTRGHEEFVSFLGREERCPCS